MFFSVDRRLLADVSVVRVQGHLVAGTAAVFRHCVDAALEESPGVVVDLRDVVDLDHHAVGALDALRARAARRGGALRVASAGPAALHVLDAYELTPAVGGRGDVADELLRLRRRGAGATTPSSTG